jgi:tetratricopeptide (TPR) repeat protein
MKWIIPSILLFTVTPAFSAGPDDQYLKVYTLMQEGEVLEQSGEKGLANNKFQEAHGMLKKLKVAYPNWNEIAVNYRLNFLQEKVSSTGGVKPAVPAAPQVASPKAQDPEVEQLKQRVVALEGDRRNLELKLREALTAPAPASAELTAAQHRLTQLEKERDLLRTTLEEQQKKAGRSPADERRINALTAENEKAQGALRQAEEALADAKKEREEVLANIKRLESELQQAKRARNPENETEANAQKSRIEKAQRELAQQKDELQKAKQLESELRDEMKVLRQGKTNLEKELKESTEKIARLEKKQRSLEDQLAKKEKRSRGGDKAEIAALKARLQVYEAKAIPYTAEELALFRAPDIAPRRDAITLVSQSGSPTTTSVSNEKAPAPISKKPAKGSQTLPPGAGALAAEAERAFLQKRYEEAEKKYLQLLSQDTENVYTLANLAATQIELGRSGEAERNLQKAIEADPEDAYSLTMMGILRFKQSKWDEALTALSKSAQIKGDSAETQNYLGIALSQKGMRAQAEAALRKAIQLQPDYPSAHYNLGIVYATQKPPFVELARYHYNRALALGHPKNEDLERMLQK